MASKLEAVDSLMELGMTEYEARCFVALTQLSEGTAKEVSRIADVPQSRVYDIADELHQMGVVDVQESEPRKYRVLPVQRALERLQREYDAALETAADRLESLETRSTSPEGVWEIADQRDILDRLQTHFEAASKEIFLLVAAEQLLDEAVLETLREASGRGVSIYVAVPNDDTEETVLDAVPDAAVSVTDLPLQSLAVEGRQPGRLALVDRETVVLSSLQEGLVPGESEETGLWGTGAGHGLVVWLRPILETHLEHEEFASP
ncbi:TrmB family transcriptional regulator [Natronomonas salina]|uniref:TrmB family transcriptional regulator n=1 Tax=Natronomonas salina TaxID=1710540 RepID=UPI0015B3DBAB|nr:TrmB family transcriptional regulator [Natronomonas salina]QLD88718.1 TrmB family transcriptional regulator [Natronomonas salina]